MLFCSSKVVHLPQHMRKVHKWTKEAASKVLSKFNIRKQNSPETSKNTENIKKEAKDFSTMEKKKDYHCRRPVNTCHSIVIRLPAHLQKVHKMSTSSQTYRKAMSTASYVPGEKHAKIRMKEEFIKKRKIDAENNAANLGESSNENQESKNENQGEASHQVSSEPPSPDADGVLLQFENWLLSPDGGKRDEKTGKQHRTQLATILKIIDETSDIHSLLNIKLIRHIFLKEYVQAKKYEAGTTNLI